MSDKLATPEDKVGQVKGSLSGKLAYKRQQFQFTLLHSNKPWKLPPSLMSPLLWGCLSRQPHHKDT